MAAITATEAAGTADAHDDHPSDAIYWKVFGFLLVLTALEVSTYWWPEEWHRITAVLLLIMMTIKFITVAFYFMHLKGDPLILRRVFFTGLILAILVYTAGLAAMVIFDDSGNAVFNDPPREKPLPPPATDPPPIIRAPHGH